MQSAWVVVTEALGPCEYEDQGETTGFFFSCTAERTPVPLTATTNPRGGNQPIGDGKIEALLMGVCKSIRLLDI